MAAAVVISPSVRSHRRQRVDARAESAYEVLSTKYFGSKKE
jgi:hypothetical protein